MSTEEREEERNEEEEAIWKLLERRSRLLQEVIQDRKLTAIARGLSDMLISRRGGSFYSHLSKRDNLVTMKGASFSFHSFLAS